MRKGARVRIFSLKRAALSFLVGFLVPFAYVLTLFLVSYYIKDIPLKTLEVPIAWPTLLWDFFINEPREDVNFAAGLLFMTICNVALYGTITYVVVLTFSMLRREPVVFEPPPAPEHFHSGPP